ncbi:MAG: methyltransferase domain-containing protein [Gemmatimonadota bacterium]
MSRARISQLMTEWFEEWFGEDYLALYPHRDQAEADRLVALIQHSVGWRAGWRVLDVGCGAGRHARALEAAGARCFGLDLSAALLRRARGMTEAPLIRADMRVLPIRSASMDLTVNLFTSFGYFANDAEHADAIREMADTLRPGGWLALDFLNAKRIRDALVPSESAEIGGVEVAVSRALTEHGRFVEKTIAIADGRSYLERVRLFEAADLRKMFEAAGLHVRHSFGDYTGAPLSAGAPRVVLLGRKS